MTRLRILFDADDVAETLLEGWVKALNERYGTTTSVEDVTDWDVSKAFPTLTKQQIYGVLQEDEVWANLTPMPGAQEYLKRLYDEGHELYMVTATDYRVSSQEKWAKFRHKVYQCRGEVSPGSIPAEKLVSNGLVVLQSVAGAGHVNNLAAVDEAVEDSGGNGSVAKEVGPLVKPLVGSNDQ